MNLAVSMGLTFVLMILLLGLFFQFVFRYILTYRFEKKGLAAVYFGFLYVMYIKYGEIQNIRVISLRETLWHGGLGTIRAGNRLAGPVLAFTRKKGLLRYVFLTPDDPHAFAEKLKRRVKKG